MPIGDAPAGALDAVAPYFDEFDEIRTDAVARRRRWWQYDPDSGSVVQQLVDPEEYERLTSRLEDELDRAMLQLVREEDDYIPWEQAKRDLGLT